MDSYLLKSLTGYFKLKKYIKIHHNVIFMGASGIGDQCIAAAYLDEYLKDKEAKILCASKSAFVFNDFGINNLEAISAEEICCMRMAYLRNPITARLLKKEIKREALCIVDVSFYIKREYCYKNPNLTAMDINRYVSFSLTRGDEVKSYPRPMLIAGVKEKYIACNRYVILNPYSASMTLDESVFERIVEYLNSIGVAVYCNVCGDQKVINGTIPLKCSVQELFFLSKEAEAVISIRSGILDYIVSNTKKIIAIYDSPLFYHLYSLKSWETETQVYELLMEEDEKLFDKIVACLK